MSEPILKQFPVESEAFGELASVAHDLGQRLEASAAKLEGSSLLSRAKESDLVTAIKSNVATIVDLGRQMHNANQEIQGRLCRLTLP